MDYVVVLLLLVLGVVFFIIELFLLPGISIAGIVGCLFAGGSIYYAYSQIGTLMGTLTLIFGIVLFLLAIWQFMRSKTLDKFALKTDIDSKMEPLKGLNIEIGDKGVTASRLAPMGKVKINGATMEAKTNDDFIDSNEEIIVVEIYNTNVLVKRATQE